ncbi:MAG: fructose-bisphosphatase class II [Candidatus Zixiibacteriota bacterium]|nr:MAG: fructose-bisphosphatase class II [candidate division Zixibacteria bacterium]
MEDNLRFNIADQRISYNGKRDDHPFDDDQIIEFNHRHKAALSNYDLSLEACNIITLCDQINYRSNLGALRNRQVRQSVILSAALSAVAIGVHGRGSINKHPKDQITKELTNLLKRANDRTSAQIMAEVLQTTTETLPVGEEVLIECTITEGVRMKPGKEPGGNPTIAVGAVFGKERHRDQYGLSMLGDVTLLSMGTDVVEGTTKSIKGLHSSMTALFVTEANVKRHLPDIYVQRWMSGAHFKEFNPRETSLLDAAEIVASSYGFSDVGRLSSYFLDRPRHYPAMDILNQAGISTPFDKDGDLMPAVILGMDGVQFPDQRGLLSMIGEIGGSAEWAIGVLPLVWRGGQAIGMLTSQSSLTNKALSPEEMWKERFHYTEEEFMLIQDARFERKPYFTVSDIIDNPFAGGISAFGAITDNYFIPFMEGVKAHPEDNRISLSVLTVNSLGVVECWQMTFKANRKLEHSIDLMKSPKEKFNKLRGQQLEQAIGQMLNDEYLRKRYRIFFTNEYYPALIPVRDKMVILHRAVEGLIERQAIQPQDRDIIEITERLAPNWFANSD